MLLAAEHLSLFRHDDERRRATDDRRRNQNKLTSLSSSTQHPTSALAVDIGNATSSTSSWEELVMSSDAQSYSQQYDRLFAALPLDVKKVRRRRALERVPNEFYSRHCIELRRRI